MVETKRLAIQYLYIENSTQTELPLSSDISRRVDPVIVSHSFCQSKSNWNGQNKKKAQFSCNRLLLTIDVNRWFAKNKKDAVFLKCFKQKNQIF